jgi:hypothetical protein
LYDYRAGRILTDYIAARGEASQKIMAQTVLQKFAAAYGNGIIFRTYYNEETDTVEKDMAKPVLYGQSTTGFMELNYTGFPPENYPEYVKDLLGDYFLFLYPTAIPDIAYPYKHLKVTLDDRW